MFKAVRKFVTVPYLLNEIVKTRWSELGYRSFSGYLVGLIRYDLLIGGKHTLTAQMGSDAPDIQGHDRPRDRHKIRRQPRTKICGDSLCRTDRCRDSPWLSAHADEST